MKKNKNSSANEDLEYALVYSTDSIKENASTERHCIACSRQISKCVCKVNTQSITQGLKPAVRLERKGRGGKSVTVITKLPAHATYIKDLLSYLKRSIGCGGTSYIEDGEGVIELQGERQKQAIELISKYNK